MTALKLPGLDYDTAALEEFCQRWGVTRLSIFGSAARNGLGEESDVDVMVSFAEDSRVSLWDFVTMKDELSTLFGHPVDLIEDGTVRNPIRKKAIERDLRVVYAA
ncbi:MAG TPA: nucleotidyltransferase family protein [Dehalococcoidia bacterium]